MTNMQYLSMDGPSRRKTSNSDRCTKYVIVGFFFIMVLVLMEKIGQSGSQLDDETIRYNVVNKDEMYPDRDDDLDDLDQDYDDILKRGGESNRERPAIKDEIPVMVGDGESSEEQILFESRDEADNIKYDIDFEQHEGSGNDKNPAEVEGSGDQEGSGDEEGSGDKLKASVKPDGTGSKLLDVLMSRRKDEEEILNDQKEDTLDDIVHAEVAEEDLVNSKEPAQENNEQGQGYREGQPGNFEPIDTNRTQDFPIDVDSRAVNSEPVKPVADESKKVASSSESTEVITPETPVNEPMKEVENNTNVEDADEAGYSSNEEGPYKSSPEVEPEEEEEKFSSSSGIEDSTNPDADSEDIEKALERIENEEAPDSFDEETSYDYSHDPNQEQDYPEEEYGNVQPKAWF